MVYVVTIFVLCCLYKLVKNIIRFIQSKKLLKEYELWLNDSNWEFVQKRHSFIKIMSDAGIKDSMRPHMESVGYGMVSTNGISVQDNFPNRRKDIASITISMMNDATGVYKSRLLETFSIIYWIDLVVFLPKNLSKYFGYSEERMVVKIFQFIWWVLGLAVPIVIGLFKSEIDVYIKELLSQ